MRSIPGPIRQRARRLLTMARDPATGEIDALKLEATLESLYQTRPRGLHFLIAELRRRLEAERVAQLLYVDTAIPLSDTIRAPLECLLRAAFGLDREIEYRVQQELVGGLRVRVGDAVLDGSVKGRLRALRSRFEESRGRIIP